MTYRLKRLTEQAVEAEPKALMRWINGEFLKIEVESSHPHVQGISFETLYAVPARYQNGDLYYGAAGVFGGQEGLYLRDAGNWRKL